MSLLINSTYFCIDQNKRNENNIKNKKKNEQNLSFFLFKKHF